MKPGRPSDCTPGKAPLLLVSLLVLSLVIPPVAFGSRPVQKTIRGCVVGGQLFDIVSDGTNKPVKAFPIRVQDGLDWTVYEGKTISLEGYLLPGDRFVVKKGAGPVVVNERCDSGDREVIQKEFIMGYRVAGYRAAKAGDFDGGLRWTNKALDMDRTLCGTYLDRANIHFLKGDTASGLADIKTIRDGGCADPKGLNFLVIEEIGAILEKAGKKSEALKLYRLGLDSCNSDMCRNAMENAIHR